MSELLIIQTKGNSLSKQQIEFNKLIASIDKRKKDLNELQHKLKTMTGLYEEKVQPVRCQLSSADVKLIEQIDQHFENKKLSKKEKEKSAQMILNISQHVTEPQDLEKLQPIVTKYIAFQQKDLSAEEKELADTMLKSIFSSAFGVDVADEELDINDPAQMGELFKRKIAEERNSQQKEHFFNAKHKSYNGNGSKQAQAAELLRKSWKLLYTKLVRRLHPDTEPDEGTKLIKTELLKKVTVAYEQNDFLTLLQLYQQEIGFNEADAATAQLQDKDILGTYISILKKQQSELIQKINDVKWEAAQNNFGFISYKNAWQTLENHIVSELFILSAKLKSTQSDLVAFAVIESYKSALASINLQELLPGEDDFFFDDEMDEDFFDDFLFEARNPKKSKKK